MSPAVPTDSELELSTDRLVLEPITTRHAEELCSLFADAELHRYLPSDPPSLEVQRTQCERWARRRSPDGTELWLNWAARHRADNQVIAHLQAGVVGAVASLAYVVARDHQQQGVATEALRAVMALLRDRFDVTELTAHIDTRNHVSIALVKRLGLQQEQLIEGADFFKGEPSDEYVFKLRLG
jgi:RimJ/RimL family protein N-acetyltransferase